MPSQAGKQSHKSLGIVIIGIILGVALSDTIGMRYNILIMPIIGAIGYLDLKKKAYYIPIALFVFSYVWLFIKYHFQGIFELGFIITMFIMPIYWSGIYAGLCTVGVIIASLLKFAFGIEVKNEN